MSVTRNSKTGMRNVSSDFIGNIELNSYDDDHQIYIFDKRRPSAYGLKSGEVETPLIFDYDQFEN